MHPTATLESLARLLPDLGADGIAECACDVSDASYRLGAAQLLRDAAAMCANEGFGKRLRDAALAIETGKPCALTPDGLTWRGAAAAETVSGDTWTGEPVVETAGRELVDTHGNATAVGQVLRLLIARPEGNGFHLSFLDRNFLLSEAEAMENGRNLWFQPVPSQECLVDLCEAIEDRWSELDELLHLESDDEDENLLTIHEDIERCAEWLAEEGGRGPAPECTTADLAAQVFGKSNKMTAWVRSLFAGVGKVR